MSMKKFPDSIEKRFLEEYKELGLCWRHDDEWFSKLTAVLLPLSIAALTLPYLKDGIPKLLAVVGGLMLMAFWFFSSCICTAKLRVRFSRIHDIERILGLDSHLRYDAARGEGAKKDKRVLKAQRLRLWMFKLYLVITLFVMCDIKVEPTDPKVKIAHSVAQFIRVSSNPKVETAVITINVWPPFGLWSTDAGIAKLVITAEAILVGIVAALVYLAYWMIRDRTRSNAKNKV